MIAGSKVADQISRAIIENDGKTDDKKTDKPTHLSCIQSSNSHAVQYRAKVYENYYFLCLANTRVSVRWLVYKHALVGRCEKKSAVRKLYTK